MKSSLTTKSIFHLALLSALLSVPKASPLFASPITRDVWNHKAEQWHEFIGKGGEKDLNRRFQVDPTIFQLAGSLKGKTVLDAGSGTGYLSAKMATTAQRVLGIDISEKMIEIARVEYDSDNLEFEVGNLEDLRLLVPDESVDLVVSNHVLMDLADLDAAVSEFSRVLRPGGRLVVAILHPCFPMKDLTYRESRAMYDWTSSYFNNNTVLIPPFSKEFDSDFIVFQRPLSVYLKAMMLNGLQLEEFVEPVISEKRRLEIPREVFERFKHVPISLVMSFIKY